MNRLPKSTKKTKCWFTYHVEETGDKFYLPVPQDKAERCSMLLYSHARNQSAEIFPVLWYDSYTDALNGKRSEPIITVESEKTILSWANRFCGNWGETIAREQDRLMNEQW